ncbi:MAG: SH3 domain-containing protein [Sandaracinaceae bacterium]|nr:SH3 domain-containing protein [Sandaracinaceae bacterium]
MSRIRSAVAALATFSALVGASSAFAQTAPARPWARPLAEAQRAYAQRQYERAAERFEEADQALGGYPYEEGEEIFDDDGHWIHAAERQPIREALQCPWALSVLRSTTDAEDDEEPRAVAVSRAELSCGPAELAAVAMLLGHPREAALRIARGAPSSALPAPIDAATAAWAAQVHAGTFPVAHDVEEAVAFVQAHVAAEHSVVTRCGAPYGLLPTRPGQHRPIATEDEEPVDDSAEPFASGTPDAIAFVRCAYSPAVSPYEDPGMGPGAETVEYLLVRDAAGIHVGGSFRGFPEYECWTGVIQARTAHYAQAAGPGRRLYVIERVEGYTEYDENMPSSMATELVVCDPARGACRTLPIALEATTVTYPDDPDSDEEPVPHHREWRARARFTGGRVSLSTVRGAPSVLARFGGRGITLDELFAAPPISAFEFDQAPTASAPPAAAATTSASCPWRVADPDGQTNVRAEPDTSRPAIGTIPTGTTIVPVERRGRWWRVEAPVAGWLWAPNLRQQCP